MTRTGRQRAARDGIAPLRHITGCAPPTTTGRERCRLALLPRPADGDCSLALLSPSEGAIATGSPRPPKGQGRGGAAAAAPPRGRQGAAQDRGFGPALLLVRGT